MQARDFPLEKLLETGQKEHYPKGKVVEQTEFTRRFALINEGYVKRYLIGHNGAVSIRDIYGPGYFFPMTTAYATLLGINIYEGPETYYYETMSRVEIFSMDSAVLAKEVRSNPLLYRDLFMVSGRRLRSYINSAESHSLRNAYQRLAHLLVYLANEFGDNNTMLGAKLSLPLTRADMASMLGVARGTATRKLTELQENGLINMDGSKIAVPNIIKLEAEAYGGAS